MYYLPPMLYVSSLLSLLFFFYDSHNTLVSDMALQLIRLSLPVLFPESLCLPLVILSVVVQSLSHVQLFSSPWTAAHQASLSFTVSQSLLKLMSIESVMPSNHLILCLSLLLLPSTLPSIRGSSHQVAKVLELQFQHQSFQ